MTLWSSFAARRGALGRRGERAAGRYLRRRGLRILATNVRFASGEIDIVAREGATVVFVEVKSRTTREGDEWSGFENMNRRKRAALRRACNACRRALPERMESFRLDVVTVEFRRRRWGSRVHDVRWYSGVLDLDF